MWQILFFGCGSTQPEPVDVADPPASEAEQPSGLIEAGVISCDHPPEPCCKAETEACKACAAQHVVYAQICAKSDPAAEPPPTPDPAAAPGTGVDCSTPPPMACCRAMTSSCIACSERAQEFREKCGEPSP